MRYLQIIFIIFLLAASSQGHAQLYKVKIDSSRIQKKIDSLKRLIAQGPDDSLKLSRLMMLTATEGYIHEYASVETALRAKDLAEKLHNYRAVGMAYRELGMIYEKRKDFTTAISYYQKAVDLTDRYQLYSIEDNAYPAVFNLYFYLGDYPSAMQTVMKQLAIAEKLNDKQQIAASNNLLGYIYFKQEELGEAEKYYERYLANAKELNDSTQMAHALGEVADLYIYERKFEKAFNALNTCIGICDKLVRPVLNEPGRSKAPQLKAKAMYRLGRIYQLTGKLPEALRYAMAAVDFTSKSPATNYDIASYYILAGNVYKDLGDHNKAIDYLNYGFKLSREIQHRENTMEAAQYLSETYALKKKYDSAFYFFQRYTGLKDSIVNNETKMKIAGIQAKYDVAKKDRQIARQREMSYILTGSFILLLVILLFIYNSYRLKEKNKYQQEHNRQQNELFNVIVSTQDQERKRIAQDIHDSLGSVLSAAKLKLSSLDPADNLFTPDQLEKYQTTLSLLNEASSELRNISHNIMPATLSKLGLVAALENLIGKISTHSGMQISFAAHGLETRIEETAEISIYRIILELINNIVKHASADKVTIQMIKYPAYINLTIEDNGRGFDYVKTLEEKKGIGLGNILSRVEYLKGTFEIDSSPGEGTTVIIEIPYTSGDR